MIQLLLGFGSAGFRRKNWIQIPIETTRIGKNFVFAFIS
jgi:hypothetical protein